MVGWFRRLFTSKDTNNEDVLEKKNKLSTEEYDDVDTTLYTHPMPQHELETNMPSKLEEQDVVDTTVQVVNEQGRMVSMSRQQASGMMEKVPDGLGKYGIPTSNNKNGGAFSRKSRDGVSQHVMHQQQPMQQPMQQPIQSQQPMQQPMPMQQPAQQPMQQQPMQQPMQQPTQIPINQPQQPQQQSQQLYPPHEIATLVDAYHLYIEIPGIVGGIGGIGLSFDNGVLNIESTRIDHIDLLRKEKKGTKRKNPINDSYSTVNGTYFKKRSLEFPFQKLVEESEIGAEYTDGILHVTLPLRNKGKKVEISIK
jgi:HSP20 family molecular chaperone IbpA